MSALELRGLAKSFGGLRVTADVEPRRRARRAATDHRPQRRRQDDALQPHHRRARSPMAARFACSAATSRVCRAATARISVWRAPIRSSRSFPRDTLLHNVMLSLLGPVAAALEFRRAVSTGSEAFVARAQEALKRVGLGRARRPTAGADLLWRAPARRDRHGAGAAAEAAAARRAVRRPLARRAQRRDRSSCSPSRATSPWS